MYVCTCYAVTERQVRLVIASGTKTVDELARVCHVGLRCAGCRPALCRLIDECQLQDAS